VQEIKGDRFIFFVKHELKNWPSQSMQTDAGAIRRNESMPWKLCADRPVKIHPDFRELLALFNERGIEYIINVHYLGIEQYAQNKRATGRKKDFADLEALGEG
jgi:hypothetical protein